MMAPPTILSTVTFALLLLSRLSAADDFSGLDSCTKSAIPKSKCAESDTKCVCDAANNEFLNQLVDYLNTSCDHHVDVKSQLITIQNDCDKKGYDIDISAVIDASINDGIDDGGAVVVASNDSTHTLTSVPKYSKTTISIVTTETMITTDDIETTDASGNEVKTETTRTELITKTSASESTVATSYVDVTYTVQAGTVSVGDGTVYVGGPDGTVVVGPGSVYVAGDTTATTTNGNEKPHKTTAGVEATDANGNAIDSTKSSSTRALSSISGVAAAVLACVGIGGLFFVF